LTNASASRGSTYTFVSSGNADVSTLENQVGDQTSVASPPTLRFLLRRLDQHNIEAERENAPKLPRTISLDTPRDPCEAGILTRGRSDVLVSYFNKHLSPWIAALDPSIDVAGVSSSFLLSTILYQASKYCNDVAEETVSLALHTRMLATIVFAEGDTTSSSVLAFYLFSAWKTPDDAFTDLYTSYADRIGMKNASSHDRQSKRINFFHYVQQNVFLLHYCPFPIFNNRNILTRQALSWSQEEDAYTGDWFLCADVESTAIQCRYKVFFEEQQNQHCSSFTTSLLQAFLHEIDDWEYRWTQEARAKEGKNGNERGTKLRMAGFGLFRNSVCTHISSIALCESLRSWLVDGTGTSQSNVASNVVTYSYKVCLNSAMGVLDQMISLDSHPEILLHMPDSLVILADHASLLAIYLLLVPAATSRSHSSNSNPGSQSLEQIHQLSEGAAPSCIDKIKRVEGIMRRASILRPSLTTCISLSADYLASLVDLIEGRHCSGLEDQPSSSAITSLSLPFQEDAALAWDWLQSFLDNSTSPMFQ
jgi:hypothetical protein